MKVIIMKKNAIKIFSLLTSICLMLCLSTACSSSSDDPEPEPVPELTTTQKVNNFAYDAMQMLYLWNKDISSSITTDSSTDSYKYFNTLCYGRVGSDRDNWIDKWSALYNTTSTRASRSDIDETETGYGYQPLFLLTGDGANDPIFPLIMYVNPGSPASKAGLERGSVIYKVNGEFLTKNTYGSFYNSTSASIELGEFYVTPTGNSVRSLGQPTISLKASKQYFDTVVHSEVINEDDPDEPNIGYICYTGYSYASESKLVSILQDFKAKDVTDIVLDLRYNPGGYANMALYLSSMLAPADVIRTEKTFLKEAWNDYFMQSFKETPKQNFKKDVAVNMDLSRLYVLTTSGTASASEATMVGLMPYIDVIQIGEQTHGKFCGAMTFTPEYFYVDLKQGTAEDAKAVKDWEAMIMLYKFMNVDDKSPQGGLTPNHEIEDFSTLYLEPFGSKQEPMIAKALSLITGKPMPETRAASGIPTNMKALPTPQPEGLMIVDKKDLPELPHR